VSRRVSVSVPPDGGPRRSSTHHSCCADKATEGSGKVNAPQRRRDSDRVEAAGHEPAVGREADPSAKARVRVPGRSLTSVSPSSL